MGWVVFKWLSRRRPLLPPPLHLPEVQLPTTQYHLPHLVGVRGGGGGRGRRGREERKGMREPTQYMGSTKSRRLLLGGFRKLKGN